MKTETKRNISACIAVVALIAIVAFPSCENVTTVFWGTIISLLIFVASAWKAGAFRQS